MISIILPTYNSIKFLTPRLETIINQTFQDWECIVIDGESTDGTWEYLQNVAKENSKFELYQFPPKGPYDAWNKGIQKAKGEYIYIATSDDTMTADCLEVMCDALDKSLDCGIAHCNLTLIDENGKATSDQWKNWGMANFLGDHLNHSHIRQKPYDAILYMNYKTAYTSITQLLVRRLIYEDFGFFSTDFGNIADFEWGLRITQCTNTIHIPKYLATWRQHSEQLSENTYFRTGDYFDRLLEMVLLCNRTLEKLKIKSICAINPAFYLPYLKEVLRRGTIIQRVKWFLKKPVLSMKIGYQYIFKNSLPSSAFIDKQLNKMELNQNLLST